jgi:hypothetical protein
MENYKKEEFITSLIIGIIVIYVWLVIIPDAVNERKKLNESVKIEYTPNSLYKRTEEKQEWEYKECKHILYNRYCIDCREYEWNKRLNK